MNALFTTLITAGGGVISRKIPVACVGWASLMEGFNGLENHLDRGFQPFWRDQFGYFV